MKKLFITTFLLMAMLSGYAQYREVKLPKVPKQTNYRNYEADDKGFWCAFEAETGSSVMEQLPNMQYANLSWTGGYRLSEFLRLGAGLGVRYYYHNSDVRNTDTKLSIPIFANVRGNFISAYDRDGVPFWSVNIGGITHERFFASPTFGYSFGGLRKNFQIGVSYMISCFENSDKENKVYSSFGVKLGYEF